MVSAHPPSHKKRPAALESGGGSGADEFMSNTKNHKPNDEIFGNRLEMLGKMLF